MTQLQRTDDWFEARLGCVTASRIGDVCARTKTGWGAARKNYMYDLVVERLSGTHVASGTGAARRWGEEVEPEAKIAYEFYRDATIVEAGFIKHPTIGDTGASPDGLIVDDGLVEFKCPTLAVHLETLAAEEIAQEYVLQMQWQMCCTGRKWCDFASYDPRFPETMRLYVRRVPRDDILIAALEKDVIDFLNELRLIVHRLRSKYDPETIVPGELLAMAG
jgi:putative phage-type endonuclease